ncbi:MAG TPA: ester cyclase [Candidatus Acidoferrales bacterium]|nr:ester cyclase [Candidatus Acidoferrales bacterium]
MTPEEGKALIRRYYDELWNAWRFDVAAQLLDPEIHFRGSLGRMVEGLEGFLGYMKHVQAAFPDFHNSIEECVAEPDCVAARLLFTGTHRGEIFGVAPTGRRVRYSGAGLFHLRGGRIADAWVLGDLAGLLLQLRPVEP